MPLRHYAQGAPVPPVPRLSRLTGIIATRPALRRPPGLWLAACGGADGSSWHNSKPARRARRARRCTPSRAASSISCQLMCRSPDPGYEWSQNGYGDGSSSKKTKEVAAGLLEDFLRASEVNLLRRQLRVKRLLCDRDGVAGSEGEAVIGSRRGWQRAKQRQGIDLLDIFARCARCGRCARIALSLP